MLRRPAGAAPGRRGRRQANRRRLLRRGLDYWQRASDVILVEGAGGLMSPLGDDEYVADLAADFGFPLVVVSRNVLGTINQHAANAHRGGGVRGGLPVAGVVLNNPARPPADDVSLSTNRAELAARCVPPLLTEVAYGAGGSIGKWIGLSWQETCQPSIEGTADERR